MSISKLRERVLVQKRAYIADHLGGYKFSWADGGEFWAEVSPMTGGEQADEAQDLSRLRYRIRWRVGTTVPSTARLQWRGSYLKFLTVPQADVYRRFMSAIVVAEVSHE